jgi:hypothetical protein
MTAQLSQTQELDLAQRLSRWRSSPISLTELAELLPQVSDPCLALSVGERLGMAGPEAFPLLAELCISMGMTRPLIRALGLSHHPSACTQLLEWLPQADALEGDVLQALSCWGHRVDLEIISSALEAPSREHRLAGLALLTFRCRSLTASRLLELIQPLLSDIRADVVIATLKLLQRREEPPVLAAIRSCIHPDSLPGVAEAALLGLGCIETEASCLTLLELVGPLQGTRLEVSLIRQLHAQQRHRELLQSRLKSIR